VAHLLSGMIRRVLIPAVICALFCAASAFAQNAPAPDKPADYADADGYAVLSILLAEFHPAFGNVLEIGSTTTSGERPDSFEACGSKIPADYAGAASDFKDKNKQTWRLAKKFNLKFSYKFFDVAKKKQPLTPTNNAKDLPPPVLEQSVYQVSVVGFDATRTHAIAYLASICGPDCSSGGYHLMYKDKDGWKEYVSSPVCESVTTSIARPSTDRGPS
jgi:hypothetical protein